MNLSLGTGGAKGPLLADQPPDSMVGACQIGVPGLTLRALSKTQPITISAVITL